MNSKLKVGDKIRIISFPRPGDGADGFAGTVGVVEKINYNERFDWHQIGSICLKLENGSTLMGVGITRMRYEKID